MIKAVNVLIKFHVGRDRNEMLVRLGVVLVLCSGIFSFQSQIMFNPFWKEGLAACKRFNRFTCFLTFSAPVSMSERRRKFGRRVEGALAAALGQVKRLVASANLCSLASETVVKLVLTCYLVESYLSR